MGGKAFEKIMAGLRHALADAKGEPGHVTRITYFDAAGVRTDYAPPTKGSAIAAACALQRNGRHSLRRLEKK